MKRLIKGIQQYHNPRCKAHADQSPMFVQGWSDRGQWEQWFNGLPAGDYKTGAFYWASQRSLPNPGTCKQMNDEFYKGCTAAKAAGRARLSAITAAAVAARTDLRPLTNSRVVRDFARGWRCAGFRGGGDWGDPSVPTGFVIWLALAKQI